MMKVPQKTQSRTKYSGELKPNDNKNEPTTSQKMQSA